MIKCRDLILDPTIASLNDWNMTNVTHMFNMLCVSILQIISIDTGKNAS